MNSNADLRKQMLNEMVFNLDKLPQETQSKVIGVFELIDTVDIIDGELKAELNKHQNPSEVLGERYNPLVKRVFISAVVFTVLVMIVTACNTLALL